MKKVKKMLALLLAAMMVLAMGITAMAQDVDAGAGGSATITIENAAKGETYAVYKLFDATVTGEKDGSIAYTGTIPNSLTSYFRKDNVGNISVVENVNEADLVAALKEWAESESTTATASAESDGSTLKFVGLGYGYYVVTTTQGDAAITVTSTNPNATIVDKNSTTPTPGDEDGNNLKTVDDADVSIGDTVTYTIKFTTANFEGAGTEAKRILSYTITDTLPDFLSDVTVTGITIGDTAYNVNGSTPQFGTDGKITIPWVNNDKASLYDNGAVLKITYTAKVNDKIAVGGAADTNKNSVTINWNVDDGTTPGGSESTTKLEDNVVISTYAAAIQKVDADGNNLAGAKFSIKGLTVTGSKGNYKVVSYDPSENTTVTGTEMEADDNGLIVISGIASDETLVASETVAPDGYNKLTTTVNVTPAKTSETITTTTTTTTTYYDAEGNVTDEENAVTTKTVTTVTGADKVTPQKIENKKGATLPTTGGMGTTIFYILGCILVLGAAVLLVTKRRMRGME